MPRRRSLSFSLQGAPRRSLRPAALCPISLWFRFYDSIEGFQYEEGHEYVLRIERFEAYPGREPPADASKYGYRLLDGLSKTPVRIVD